MKNKYIKVSHLSESKFRELVKLFAQTVFIVDKKAHQKKAVIMPYEEYEKLLKQSIRKENLEEGSFNKFVGILDEELETDDEKYKAIVE